ncbi:hypothetical protein [Nocardia ninae]|uniref:hypothetical protein n=1 Tax=Nocardia ninae TaxID=356145 RepID=UPI0011BE4468|nr:hypothetical protein [Nocardia ninae]
MPPAAAGGKGITEIAYLDPVTRLQRDTTRSDRRHSVTWPVAVAESTVAESVSWRPMLHRG